MLKSKLARGVVLGVLGLSIPVLAVTKHHMMSKKTPVAAKTTLTTSKAKAAAKPMTVAHKAPVKTLHVAAVKHTTLHHVAAKHTTLHSSNIKHTALKTAAHKTVAMKSASHKAAPMTAHRTISSHQTM